MPTTSFSYTAAKYSGRFIDAAGAQPYRQCGGANARVDLSATGTALVLECYVGTGGTLRASVDGGAYVDITPGTLNAFTTTTVFTGLADTAHNVTIRPPAATPGNSYLQRDAATFRVTGAAPACVPSTAMIPIQVICDGNSTTHGFGTTAGATQPDGSTYPDSYPNQLQALLGSGYEVTNLGVDGRYTETQASAAATGADWLYYANQTSWYVGWEGYNSILGRGDTVAAAWSSMSGLISARKSVGWKTVTVSLPRATYTGTTLADYDALVVANAPGSDAVFLPSGDSRIANTADATVYNGAPHMTRLGYGYIAADVAALIAPSAPVPRRFCLLGVGP